MRFFREKLIEAAVEIGISVLGFVGILAIRDAMLIASTFLVERAAKCEPIIIANAGKPLVNVIAADTPEPPQHKRLGFMLGKIHGA